ncbi:unnamed protein product, partial [marine sediment metagenome]
MLKLENPFIGILIGMLFTALIQSSAAFVGILIVLGTQGLLSLEAAIPLLLGANLGTAVTAILASLNTNREAKKVALAHTFFKVVGVLLFAWWIPDFAQFIQNISPKGPPGLEEVYTKKELELMDHRVFLRRHIRMLEESVISASKWEQNKSEIPNRIKSIFESDIQFHNPQTAADLIGSSNEVFIQKSQMGGGSPMIRGFAANSVLLVIDGIRMNNAIYRSGNLHNVISLDPNIIEGSEIIFGPGSVVYGSDALGGVMDFHTKRPILSTS